MIDMEKFKGTKGEWVVCVFIEETKYYPQRYEIQHGYDGECIAEFVHNKYDAKLIATVPELLDRLMKTTKSIKAHPDYKTGRNKEFIDIVDLSESVINKALGL